MALDERQINAIVEAVVSKLGNGSREPEIPKRDRHVDEQLKKPKTEGGHWIETYAPGRKAPAVIRGRKGIFDDLDAATKAAHDAHEELVELPIETRKKIVAAMRKVTADNVRELAVKAVEETGLGRVDDKIQKNLLCAWKTPGIEILD